MTNREFARYAAQITKRSSAWTFDTMMMGRDHWDGPPINNSVERFCNDIEEIIGWLRAEAAGMPSAVDLTSEQVVAIVNDG